MARKERGVRNVAARRRPPLVVRSEVRHQTITSADRTVKESWQFHHDQLIKHGAERIIEFGAGKNLVQNLFLSQLGLEQTAHRSETDGRSRASQRCRRRPTAARGRPSRGTSGRSRSWSRSTASDTWRRRTCAEPASRPTPTTRSSRPTRSSTSRQRASGDMARVPPHSEAGWHHFREDRLQRPLRAYRSAHLDAQLPAVQRRAMGALQPRQPLSESTPPPSPSGLDHQRRLRAR